MKKLVLIALLLVVVNATADNAINNIPEDKVYKTIIYYEDENGHYKKWERPNQEYRTWTDIDSDMYDYEVIIKID